MWRKVSLGLFSFFEEKNNIFFFKYFLKDLSHEFIRSMSLKAVGILVFFFFSFFVDNGWTGWDYGMILAESGLIESDLYLGMVLVGTWVLWDA